VTWTTLLEDARLAPSPHNTQPWRLRVLSATEAELYAVADRTLPTTDPDGAFMTAGMGIFVEALDVAAAARGLSVRSEPLYPNLGAGGVGSMLFARLQLVERSASPEYPLELLERRRTARGRYDGRPAAAESLAALEQIVGDGGHLVRFTSEPDTVQWIVGLNADTVFYDLDDDATRTEIGRWIRGSEGEARNRRDGFSPRCLGFPGLLVRLFFFRHGLFASRPLRALLRRLLVRSMRGTATVGWIEGPWSTPEEHYLSGRMLLRFWLELTRRGLYLQPFGSVITNATAHAQMAARLDAAERDTSVWLLLRIGYTTPPPRSLRLGTRELVT
jgi:hypothetical protein